MTLRACHTSSASASSEKSWSGNAHTTTPPNWFCFTNAATLSHNVITLTVRIPAQRSYEDNAYAIASSNQLHFKKVNRSQNVVAITISSPCFSNYLNEANRFVLMKEEVV